MPCTRIEQAVRLELDYIRLEDIMVSMTRTPWIAGAVEEQPRSGTVYEAIAGHGPKWRPKTRADVVVQLSSRAGRTE